MTRYSRISYKSAPPLPVSIGPWPMIGTCISHLPESHSVMVLLRSGQVITVKVLTQGANDALRVDHHPLPGIGTDGLVLFPHGDVRNGTWGGSIDRNQQNAYTAAPGQPYTRYQSDWSGGWRLRDDGGNYAEVWPDGSSLVAGFSGAVPATYRQVVETGQVPTRVPLTAAQRRPVAASAFPFVFRQAAGTVVEVAVDGTVTVTTSGGAALVMSPAGAITATAPANVSITAPIMTLTGALRVTGDVIAGYGTSNISALGHVHPDPQGGDTGPPV